MKRGVAAEPLMRVTSASPPTASAIARQSTPVELSIQMGAVARLSSGASCALRLDFVDHVVLPSGAFR